MQSSADPRHISIGRVGVKSVRHPVNILGAGGRVQPSIGTFDLYVALAPEVKGTHMSRFIDLLDRQTAPVSVEALRGFMDAMLELLNAPAGYVALRAPYFVRKQAPVSGVQSLMDYEVSWTVERRAGAACARVVQTVAVPVQSLCPCSREISRYGAHNQRSLVTIALELSEHLDLEEHIRLAERNASCELWGLLKRPDEKYVTEHAYENPKFVEDIVRDVAVELNRDRRVLAYVVESENFESIHNHSAYARIEQRK